MRYEITVDIDAAPDKVWAVLTDVERWPEWTPSMRAVKRLDDTPFGAGSKVRVRQPRLPQAVYTVTTYDPGRAFIWVSKVPGVTVTADHQVLPREDGHATVHLSADQTGLLAPLLGLFTARLTRHYVTQEAEGLKRVCESAP